MNRVSGTGAQIVLVAVAILLTLGCTAPPQKKNYMLNYMPDELNSRLKQGPYPFVMRVREFEIEDAYARSQIVFRRNPYELQYYFYRLWAVKPTRMITDLIAKHISNLSLVSAVVRRYDEGRKPDYELSGLIEALEEYDSDEIWFAHLAIRFKLSRLSDGTVIYSRRFDQRKRVFTNEPEFIVRELSQILNQIMNQVAHDLDVTLAREYGSHTAPAQSYPESDTIADTPELWNP